MYVNKRFVAAVLIVITPKDIIQGRVLRERCRAVYVHKLVIKSLKCDLSFKTVILSIDTNSQKSDSKSVTPPKTMSVNSK